jgi:hypothetical protein
VEIGEVGDGVHGGATTSSVVGWIW